MEPPSPRQAAELAAAAGCRVPGCQLAPTGLYFQKYRICRQHYSAEVLDVGLGVLHRFCQQCSRTHPLSEFDGTKLSCRAGLARHTQRRKERMHRRQSGEPRKRRRQPGGEAQAALQCSARRRRLPGGAMPVAGENAVLWLSPAAAAGASLPGCPLLPAASVGHAQRLAAGRAPTALPLPLPGLPLLQQPRAAWLPSPAAHDGCKAPSLLSPALGPLTPAHSEDPPCGPQGPSLAHRRMLRCALQLREQVHGLLQVLHRRQVPASGAQPAPGRKPAKQPGTPSAGGSAGGGEPLSSSLSPGTCFGSSVDCARQAAPTAGLPGASRRSAFRRWEPTRLGGSAITATRPH